MKTRGWNFLQFLVGPIFACAFLIVTTQLRIGTVEAITALGNDEVKIDASSPTGYAGGVRRLIIPGHNEASYRWIAQTQQMFARHEWHVRRVQYDNAPIGHDVSSPSLYRWWLGLLAWIDHTITQKPVGLAVEEAALFADPLCLLLLIIVVTAIGARRWGGLATALVVAGLVIFFPFCTDFVPGLPDSRGMEQAFTLLSVIALLPGLAASTPQSAQIKSGSRFWFFGAGLFGGIAMWLNLQRQLPVEIGIAFGAAWSVWIQRKTATAPIGLLALSPWRAWSFGGALAILGAYTIEFLPEHFGTWRPGLISPLYCVAWLGAGEMLTLAALLIDKRPLARKVIGGWTALNIVLLGALPLMIWRLHLHGIFKADVVALQLTHASSLSAENFWTLLVRDGISPLIGTVVAPLILLVPSIMLLVRGQTASAAKAAFAIILVPLGISLGFAFVRLSWWDTTDALVITLFIPLVEALTFFAKPITRYFWLVAVASILVLEMVQFFPNYHDKNKRVSVDRLQAKELIERDLAHWLTKQTGTNDSIVLAPANDTSSLCYYGGLRGLATLDNDNTDGFAAAVRIASATSGEEAHELVLKREISYFVIPSWDNQLDDYATLGMGRVQGSFIETLDQWNLPPWLTPLSYQLPQIEGQEDQSVAILNVVEDQDDSVLFSRLAEYMIEMNRPALLPGLETSLRRYPGDVGALTALANMQIALGQDDDSARTLKSISNRLKGRGEKTMLWDRRVSLAILLARTKQYSLAEEIAKKCFADASEARLRTLSSGSLYHLLVLGRGLKLSFADPKLQLLALDLLPPNSRAKVIPE